MPNNLQLVPSSGQVAWWLTIVGGWRLIGSGQVCKCIVIRVPSMVVDECLGALLLVQAARQCGQCVYPRNSLVSLD